MFKHHEFQIIFIIPKISKSFQKIEKISKKNNNKNVQKYQIFPNIIFLASIFWHKLSGKALPFTR